MKVLLVGSGGREHALGWALVRSDRVTELLALPGNPGLAEIGTLIEGVTPLDVGAVAAIARIHQIDLVVVGPEAPLARGLVDALAGLGIPAFGPSRAAARLEASKAFAKDVMQRAGVPTAQAWSFDDEGRAHRHLRSMDGPYVVKADGLAAGKGVLVTMDRDAAMGWASRCLEGGFGEAGSTVVVEEYLEGPELSVFAVCDGTRAVALESARDYKRLADGDQGPNTGGMGSYSPVDLPDNLISVVMRDIIQPTLDQMTEDGCPYVGFLYAGLALTDEGPKVIEFNCRLGDPETQVLVPRLRSDLVDVIEKALTGQMGEVRLEWDPRHAVDVVLASYGYPESPRKGDRISLPADLGDDVIIFHAGTARGDHNRLMTAGGRVLNIVGLGDDLSAARSRAYEAVSSIRFAGMRYRTDIGA